MRRRAGVGTDPVFRPVSSLALMRQSMRLSPVRGSYVEIANVMMRHRRLYFIVAVVTGGFAEFAPQPIGPRVLPVKVRPRDSTGCPGSYNRHLGGATRRGESLVVKVLADGGPAIFRAVALSERCRLVTPPLRVGDGALWVPSRARIGEGQRG